MANHNRIEPQALWAADLHMTFSARSKTRFRCFSAENEDVGLFLQRCQSPLRYGEFLKAQDCLIVRVCARPEKLMHVTCS
ncbi:urease accessory protein UreE, partial [Pseudomonas syringae group genomosp. 7]|uniref:urease accessory protein UreE n=1 Tax=Pseudomonas syringae group genomosp. 7 TaxID=251699 RepID=UPI00376F9C13